MLIFIFGSDSFSSKKQVLAMKDRFLEKFDALGTNLSVFDVSSSGFEFGAVAQAVQSPAFLSPKRMVIVKNLLSSLKKADEKQWLELLRGTPESTIVILIDEMDEQKAKKMKLVSGLQGSDTHIYEHCPLSTSKAIQWIIQDAKEKSLELSSDIAHEIVRAAGTDLWLLSAEIAKIAAYCKGRIVLKADVDLLVRSTADDQIFACLDACASGDIKNLHNMIENQRDFGTADAQLFALLIRQVRLLISVASFLEQYKGASKQDIARGLGVHPFVAQKLFGQIKRFSLEYLVNLQEKMLEMDFAVKTSGLTYKQSLDLAAFCLGANRIDKNG